MSFRCLICFTRSMIVVAARCDRSARRAMPDRSPLAAQLVTPPAHSPTMKSWRCPRWRYSARSSVQSTAETSFRCPTGRRSLLRRGTCFNHPFPRHGSVALDAAPQTGPDVFTHEPVRSSHTGAHSMRRCEPRCRLPVQPKDLKGCAESISPSRDQDSRVAAGCV